MAEPETRAQAAEAAAIRRRWITLGEVIAVLAVGISGLTLWNSYSERTSAEAEREAAKREEASKAATLVLRAERADGGKRLLLEPADQGSVIQSQTFLFPTALGIDAVDTVVEPRIEAGWIEDGVKKAAREAKKETPGDRLLPVAITTRFTSGGETRDYVALYDIGYELVDGGFLEGREARLRGLSQVQRVSAKDAKARLDALWQSRR
jgi:hypothetical protein